MGSTARKEAEAGDGVGSLGPGRGRGHFLIRQQGAVVSPQKLQEGHGLAQLNSGGVHMFTIPPQLPGGASV